jgi:hypothetical protein
VRAQPRCRVVPKPLVEAQKKAARIRRERIVGSPLVVGAEGGCRAYKLAEGSPHVIEAEANVIDWLFSIYYYVFT